MYEGVLALKNNNKNTGQEHIIAASASRRIQARLLFLVDEDI